MNRLIRPLGKLVNQDVARTNAAAASARLMYQRREREDVEAYLTQRLDAAAARARHEAATVAHAEPFGRPGA